MSGGCQGESREILIFNRIDLNIKKNPGVKNP